MISTARVEDIERIARQIAAAAAPDDLLAARAAKVLGIRPPFTACLTDTDAARRLVEGTELGGRVVAVDQVVRNLREEWTATLDDSSGRLFRPGVFGQARSEAMAIVVAALRRAAWAAKSPTAASAG